MQRACLALAFAFVAAPVLSSCDGGGGCLIDSDCATDLSQVCIAQRCVPAGTVPDAGRRDAGREPDAGTPRDAGRDSGPPVVDDGGPDASVPDGGAMPCSDATGAWTTTVVTAPDSCGAAMSGYGVTITAGATVCEFTVSSNDIATMPALDGVFTLAMDNSLSGTLSPGTGAAVACSGSLSGSTLTFVCGGCVMNLNRG